MLSRDNAPEDEFAFVTPEGKEGALREKLEKLDGTELLSVIRTVNY